MSRRILKKGIREVEKILRAVQARILNDPWIKSVIKIEDISIDVTFDMAAGRNREDGMGMWEALAAFFRILRDKLRYFYGQLRDDYRF